MSKSILVIDTPKDCWECRLVDQWERCDAIKITANKYGMKVTGYEHSRPSWCPLKPLPNECTDLAEEEYFALSNMFARGWNACLDAITGDEE